MSLAFSIEVGPGSRFLQVQRAAVRWLVVIGFTTSAVFAARLSGDPVAWPAGAAVALPLAVVVLFLIGWYAWSSKRGPRPRDSLLRLLAWLGGDAADISGILHVDAEGASSWQPHGSPTPLPVELSSWYLGRWIVSLRCRPIQMVGGSAAAGAGVRADGGDRYRFRVAPLELMLASDAATPNEWRGLRRWLVWRQRGGRPGHTL